MHRMETRKITEIADMLRNAQNELAGESEVKDSTNQTITEAIEAIESWKPREFDKEELALAYSKLENALEEIPDNLEGDAVSSIRAAVDELKEEEKAASVGEGANFQPEL